MPTLRAARSPRLLQPAAPGDESTEARGYRRDGRHRERLVGSRGRPTLALEGYIRRAEYPNEILNSVPWKKLLVTSCFGPLGGAAGTQPRGPGMDHQRNASIASAMSGAGSDFLSAEDDEPVTLEGSPVPLASPRGEVVRLKGSC